MNDFTLEKGATFSFPSVTVKIPLPEKPLPEKNWLCGHLLGQTENAGLGYYPAHNDGRPTLIVAQDDASFVEPKIAKVSSCGKETVASLPPGVLDDIHNALKNPDKVVQIALQAGLKVAFSRDKTGRVNGYFITNPLDGCMVASMRRIIERPHVF